MDVMKFDRFLIKLICYTFYALLFLVPLIWIPGHVELFQFNKMMIVYLGTIVITAAWLARMIASRRVFVRRTPLDLPILLFLVSQVTSAILSIEPHTSIWGYYSRFHGGLLSTISYILLYYAFVSNTLSLHSNISNKSEGGEQISAGWIGQALSLASQFKPSKNRLSNHMQPKKFRSPTSPLHSYLLILLASATIVALYGILEHFGIDEHYWIQDVRRRVFSTLGQPNWLASFLVMITPLSLTPLLIKEQFVERDARVANFARRLGQAIGLVNSPSKASARNATVSDQKIAAPRAFLIFIPYILFAIFFITLLYTKSRSGLFGFAVMYTTFWSLTYIGLVRHAVKREADKFAPEATARLKAWLASHLSKKSRNRTLATTQISVGAAQRASQQFLITSTILALITLLVGTPFTPSLSEISDRLGSRTPAVQLKQADPSPSAGADEGGSPSEDIRKIVWSGAINVWRHWPFFGSGVETFAYSYYNFRPVEHNTVSEWDFLYNKAHNEYLNILATTGLVGLSSLLLLQGWFTLWTLKQIGIMKYESRSMDRKATKNTRHHNSLFIIHNSLLIALLSGYIGLSVTIFFGFSTVTDGLLLWMFPAFAVAVVQIEPQWRIIRLGTVKSSGKIKRLQIALVLFTLVLALYFVSQVAIRWYADRLFSRGKSLSNANRMSEALVTMQQASSLVPDEPVFHDRLSLDFARAAVALFLSHDTTSSAQLAQVAAIHSDLTVRQNPVHLNFLKNRVATLLHLSVIDVRYRKFAEETLLRSAQLAPTDPNLPYNLGLLYAQEGDVVKAIEQQRKATDLKPDYELPYIAVAQIYERLNQPQNAHDVYAELLIHDPDNPTALKAIERLATEAGTRSQE